jgi:hypothetical protein
MYQPAGVDGEQALGKPGTQGAHGLRVEWTVLVDRAVGNPPTRRAASTSRAKRAR